MTAGPTAPTLLLRRPIEADHAPIVALADEWWAGRRVARLLPRLWFRHFASTSWIAETGDGRLAGFLVGFVSPDHPDEACAHLAATNPNLRRRGIGRALFAAFAEDVAGRGVARISTVVRPEDRAAVAFLRAIGFDALEGPNGARIFGVPAVADYDGPREDRAVFIRHLREPT